MRSVLYSASLAALIAVASCTDNDNDAPGADTSLSPTAATANAGADATVNRFTSVELDGGRSANANVFSWTQQSGPPTTLLDADTPTPRFHSTSAGTYEFALQVTNAPLETTVSTDTVTVTVQERPTVALTAPSEGEDVVTTATTADVSVEVGSTVVSVEIAEEAGTPIAVTPAGGVATFEDVSLASGDNTFVVTAFDQLG
ncbi:MAG: hypothetical protein MI723_14340, partial [Caulobacterales bacterium]|nr:hypothetical protein [Caulobacterales bacterium]